MRELAWCELAASTSTVAELSKPKGRWFVHRFLSLLLVQHLMELTSPTRTLFPDVTLVVELLDV